MFEEVRKRIDQKEREMLARVDEGCLKDQNKMENFIRLIKGRTANLMETEQHILN